MSSTKTSKKRAQSGDLRKIVCRVCRSTLNFQSYKDHLTFKHPEENNRDLRGHGQQALVFGGAAGVAVSGAVRDVVRGRDGGNPPPAETETVSDYEEGEGVRVVDNNRLEDLFSKDGDDFDEVEDVVTNDDVEDSEDVIPNTEDMVEDEDMMKDVNMEGVDDVNMEEAQDSNIEGVTVERLRRERDELSNSVIKINNELTKITDKFVKNLHIGEDETLEAETMIRVTAIKKKLEVEEKIKSLTEALKELEAFGDNKVKLDKVKKEQEEDLNKILLEARSMKEITEKVSELDL